MAPDASKVGGVPTKLFADKENNCGATHQMNGKKLGQSLKNANSTENAVNAKLDAPEHQMTDESEVDGSFSAAALAIQGNTHQIDTSEQCDLDQNILQSSAHISSS